MRTVKLAILHYCLINQRFPDLPEAGKLDINEIKEIVELPSYFYIFINKVTWIILPKNNETKLFVNKLTDEYNIKIKDENNWKWKL